MAALAAAAVLSAAGLGAGGCGRAPAPTELPSLGTSAAQTVEAVQTALVRASATPAPAASPDPPATTAATPLDAQTATATPGGPCTDRAEFVDDVTYRDDSVVAPGQTLVKIWRLRNAGTCTWNASYALAYYGGARMGAPAAVPLGATVGPGATVDLSVELVAPGSPGTHQGYWRLRNPDGVFFGIGPRGDQSFWVRIVVAPAASATSTAAPTATPAVVASGALDLLPGGRVDLDSGALNPASGDDLLFSEVPGPSWRLEPVGGALLALHAPPPATPDRAQCLAAVLAADALPLSGGEAGTALCYRTGQGRPGVLVILSSGETLSFSFITWSP